MLPALLKAGSALAKGGAPKNKINPKRFAALAEQKKASAKPKGGALVLMADIKTTIVTIKSEQDKKVEGGGKDPLIRELESINTRLTDLKTALINRKKVQLDLIKGKKKLAQKQKRAAKEEENEAKKPKKTTGFLKLGPNLPSFGIFDAIFRILGILFLGWLTNFLPQILDGVKAFIQTVEKIVDLAKPIIKPIIDGLMWFTKKSVEFTAGLLGVDNTEENSIIKNFTEIAKKIPLIEAAFAAIAISNAKGILGGDQSKPDRKPDKPGKPGRGQRVGRDGRTSSQRLRDIQRSQRLRQRALRARRLRAGFNRSIGRGNRQTLRATKTLLKPVSGGLKAVGGGLQKAGGLAGKLIGGAGKFVSKLGFLSKIPIVGPLIVAVTQLIAGEPLGKAAFMGIGAALGGLLGSVITGAGTFFTAGAGAALAPIILTITQGLGAFVGELLYEGFMGKGWEAAGKKLADTVSGIFQGIGTAATAIWDWVTGGGLWELLKNVGNGISGVLGWIFSGPGGGGLLDLMGNIGKGLLQLAKYIFLPDGLLTAILKGGKTAAMAIWNWFTSGGFADLLKNLGSMAMNVVTWLFTKGIPLAFTAIGNVAKWIGNWIAGGVQRYINMMFEKDPIEVPDGRPPGIRSAMTWLAGKLRMKSFLKDRGYMSDKNQVSKFPNLLNFINPTQTIPTLKEAFFGERKEGELGYYPPDAETPDEDIADAAAASNRTPTPDNVEQPSTASSSVAPAAAPAASMSSSASSISQSASYDKPQEQTAVPFPINQAQGQGGMGGGSSAAGGGAGGGVNRYKIINDLKKSILLAQMYKG